MFEVGLSELLLLGIIGLIVIGPEKLPQVATTLGRWVGRLQRAWALTKIEVQQELRFQELKKEALSLESAATLAPRPNKEELR